MQDSDVFSGYALEAEDLILRFEALSSEDVLRPVLDLLPQQPANILDVGAGTGRDAAWLAEGGHEVVAVEPVEELRRAGMALHPHPRLMWVDDRLPDLAVLLEDGRPYDLILIVAVWQHLQPEHHPVAVSSLAAIMAPKARLILSLRHGRGSPSRPCYPASADSVVELAESEGLRLLSRRQSPSVQRRNMDQGVTWTWLCLGAPGWRSGRGSCLAEGHKPSGLLVPEPQANRS